MSLKFIVFLLILICCKEKKKKIFIIIIFNLGIHRVIICYRLFLFDYYSIKDRRNWNISVANFSACSFLVLILCISITLLLLCMYLDVAYKFKISRPKYLLLSCLFLTITWVQKRGTWKWWGFFIVRSYKVVRDESITHYFYTV